MKALTLWQPWATLIAVGVKVIETRGWGTPYRGPLAIHAASSEPAEVRRLMRFDEPFISLLAAAGYKNPDVLPRGAVVATAELFCVQHIVAGFQLPKSPELELGDYRAGRYAWFLRNVQRLPEPVPCKGRQGLWDWDAEPNTEAQSRTEERE